MNNPLSANISGLKCDSPSCTYQDKSVKVEDYATYINHPCPECGAPLLTQADYDQVQNILRVFDMFNGLQQYPIAETEDERQAKISFELNGTGEVQVKVEELEKSDS